MRYGLENAVIRKIRGVFAEHPEVKQAILYGSRVLGTYREGSDIDMTLTGADLDLQVVYSIEHKLDELNLPYLFDVSIFRRIKNESLRNHVERVGVVFYEAPGATAKTAGNEVRHASKNGWSTYPLGELASVSAGNSAPQDNALFQGGSHPFVRTADVGKIQFGVIETTADYLNEDGIVGLRRFPRGTILFPKSGASTFLNHRAMMAVDGYVASHLATIIADEEKVDPWFLLYYLHTIKAQDLVSDHGYPSVRLSLIQEIQVSLPPLPEQKRIVEEIRNAFEAIEAASANTEKEIANAEEFFQSKLNGIFKSSALVGTNDAAANGWASVDAVNAFRQISPPKKIPRKQFKREGSFPIVSQEQNLISGFWSEDADVLHVDTPLVVFGDHTRVLKYVDFDFVVGADGVKLLQPEGFLLPKYLYYFLMGHPVKPLGYARHFRLLKKLEIVFPKSLAEQKRIVESLDRAAAATQSLLALYERKKKAFSELKKSLFAEYFPAN